MSEEILAGTPVGGENVQPVATDTEAEDQVETKSQQKSDNNSPVVETREGKLFVDGVRVYSREETNRIASRAQTEARDGVLKELEVESLDQVKTVVNQLRDTSEGESLNVQSLKDAVKKREQTVDELRKELHNVKTEYALREHIGSLKDNMPTQWNAEQKTAVIDLMKARDMLALEGETFAIRNGSDYYTTDGETPDYRSAVESVGKQLGLPFAKKGVDSYATDQAPADTSKAAPISESKLKSDPAYRAAYVRLREGNRNLPRTSITDRMVTEQMKK